MLRWLAILTLAGSASLRADTTNYFTDFESFTFGSPIVGTAGWTGLVADLTGHPSAAGSGGNGIMSGVFPGLGQQGYVGQTLLAGTNCYLDIWKSAVITNASTVTFSARLEVVDSTTTFYDQFVFQAYNPNADWLWALNFDNRYFPGRIYFASGTNDWVYQGTNFNTGQAYNLVVTMDLANNRWSATLDGTVLVSPTNMVDPGVALNFDSVDLIWDGTYDYFNSGSYGNNYLVVDNYLVSSVPTPPALAVLTALPAGPLTLRLTGPNGYKFAILGSTNLQSGAWTALATNVVSGGSFDFTDPGAATLNTRFYRALWVP
jgi:hypothetical protein